MITKEQAAAIGDAILIDGMKSPAKDTQPKIGKIVAMLAVLGIAVGILVGSWVCYLSTGRFTPGVFIGPEFGFALGMLVGLYIDGKTSSRSKRLFMILMCTYLVIGVLVLTIVRYYAH